MTRHTVVLVHHHLRPGGVAGVVRMQAGALCRAGHPVVIATGEPVVDPVPDAGHIMLPDLAYRDTPLDARATAALATRLAAIADGGVLHVHNPCIGKNPSLPEVVNLLAARGQPMVLQAHDFIEDGRVRWQDDPAARARWYPVASHLRWLTINPADEQTLRRAGMAKDTVCTIHNPVQPLPVPDSPVDPSLMLYPTRGLKRKNLGELLLLAAIAPRGLRIATTLAPENPRQARGHARWEILARAAGLPIRLAGGRPLVRPGSCLGTSIQEGFGLAMAEPWLSGIPAGGRWLAGASGSLARAGWDRANTYDAITVPAAWIPRAALRAAVARATGDRDADAVMDCQFNSPEVDFGRLPDFLQRRVLRRLLADHRARDHIRINGSGGAPASSREWFASLLAPADAAMAVNARILRAEFTPAAIAAKLAVHYAAVLAARPALHGHADASMVHRAFNTPSRFHFLRLPP